VDEQFQIHAAPAFGGAGQPTPPDGLSRNRVSFAPPVPRVLLVDDSPDIRRVWRHALRRIYGWETITAAGIDDLEVDPPLDGALVDQALGEGGRGTDVLRALRFAHPQAALALITGGYPERDVLDAAASVGALFVLKPLHREKLSGWAASVRQRFRERFDPLDLAPGSERLAPRERNVITLSLERRPAREVATVLGISVSTVRSYLQTAYRKLEVGGVTELADKIELLALEHPDLQEPLDLIDDE
jgi:DNA-binding NarL/FixJ family response regulator